MCRKVYGEIHKLQQKRGIWALPSLERHDFEVVAPSFKYLSFLNIVEASL